LKASIGLKVTPADAHAGPMRVTIGGAEIRVTFRDVCELLIAGGTSIALFFGTFGVFFIVVLGIREMWQELARTSDPLTRWLGLLSLICSGYVGYRIVNALTIGRERYDKIYAVAIRLKEAGQTLQDATARGSRGEVISAELHWHDAVADVEAFRPPLGRS